MSAAQDACWSLYVGREFGIPLDLGRGPEDCGDDPFILRELVHQVTGGGDEMDRMSWRRTVPAMDVATTEHDTKGEETVCWTFTVFLWSCQLMKISRRIMDLMYVLFSSPSTQS